jgi:aspartate kinase
VLQAHGVSVNLVSTSEVTVSFTIEDSSPIDAAIPELQEIGEISVATGRAILAVVGDRIKGTIGVAARMFSSLAAEKICIDMISQGASRVNVSCVILEEHIEQGMRAVHKAFLE